MMIHLNNHVYKSLTTNKPINNNLIFTNEELNEEFKADFELFKELCENDKNTRKNIRQNKINY